MEGPHAAGFAFMNDDSMGEARLKRHKSEITIGRVTKFFPAA